MARGKRAAPSPSPSTTTITDDGALTEFHRKPVAQVKAVMLNGGKGRGPKRLVGYAIFGARRKWRHDIVFMHGTPGSRLDGAYLSDAARRAACRVIAIERPGIGLSTEQPERTIRDFAKDLQRILRNLQSPVDRFYLLAHSAGAPYALAIADIFPSDRILGVGLIAALAPWPVAEACDPGGVVKYLRSVRASPRTAAQSIEKLAQRRTQRIMDDRILSLEKENDQRPEADPDKGMFNDKYSFRIQLQSGFEAFKNSSRVRGFVQEANLVTSYWGFRPREVNYEGIRLFYGDQDTATPPEMGHYLRDQLWDAGLCIYKGVGHYSILWRCGDEIIEDLLRGPVRRRSRR